MLEKGYSKRGGEFARVREYLFSVKVSKMSPPKNRAVMNLPERK